MIREYDTNIADLDLTPIYDEVKHGFSGFPLGIYNVYYPPGHKQIIRRHWHMEYELYYLIKGDVIFHYNGTKFPLHSGQCVFVHKNVIHGVETVDTNSGIRSIAIPYKPSILAAADDYLYLQYIQPVDNGTIVFPQIITQDNDWQSYIMEEIQAIADLEDSEDALHYIDIKIHLMHIWNTYLKHAKFLKTPPKQEDYHRIQNIIAYLNQNYAENITVSDIAKHFYLSEGYLSRIFKHTTGYSLIEFINHKRIQESYQLLISTDKKITDIASMCGFSNISHFNRLFLKYVEETPSSVRAKHNSAIQLQK